MPIEFDGVNSKVSADKLQGQTGTTITIESGHSLSGSGAGLTSLPAANLTGTLPALNGSALTNLPASTPTYVQFPATQVASADANRLDDYEEGTWTPAITDDSLSDSESQAYTSRSGKYSKIGNTVLATGYVNMSSIGSLTSSQRVRITGWPFTSSDVSSPITIANPGGMNKTTNAALQGFMNSGDSYGFLVESNAAVGYTHITFTEFSVGNFGFACVYHTSQ